MKATLFFALGLLVAAPACSSATSETTVMKVAPAEIVLSNPGIAVALGVEVQDAAHVLAHLRLTNHTAQVFWLYKPLLGEGAQWTECFYVLHDTPERHSLPYQGPHAGAYLSEKSQALPAVAPTTDPDSFVRLAPGATHEVTKNLSEVFDFEHNAGAYLLTYVSFMPAMHLGKQRFETDSLEPKVRRPVYYDISLGNPEDDSAVHHIKFTVR